MNASEVKRIERASPVIAVAVELGLRIRGNMGTCFMRDRHADDGDAMTLFFNPARNSFFCKTCPDVGGGVTDLVCQVRGWDRQKAAEWLAHRLEFDRETKEMYTGHGRKK